MYLDFVKNIYIPAAAGPPPLFSALALLVLGVLADNHDLAMALYYLALLAHGLDGRPDFHLKFLLSKGVVPVTWISR